MIIDETDVEDFLEHYGVKGMKWGVRQARKELRSDAKNAGKIRKQFDKAHGSAERKAAADRYEKEVLAMIRTKDFREKYAAANTFGKGDIAAHIILMGPLAAMTIPQARKQMADTRLMGASMNESAARKILSEMRKNT